MSSRDCGPISEPGLNLPPPGHLVMQQGLQETIYCFTPHSKLHKTHPGTTPVLKQQPYIPAGSRQHNPRECNDVDTFERLVQTMMQMPLAERINTLRAERAKCICMDCPTFTDCAKNLEQGFFCFTGMSIICISHEVRCLCPTCPVPPETGLLHTVFYCTRGDEKARRYDQFLAGEMR